ncbi:MAG TPA: hypothetical protein VN452_03050 [Longilinea sp.]|nr:hypothetical protein [Longilinea sp.]
MRMPYLPPIPFMPATMPVWLSYILVFAAVTAVVLVIILILFKFATSASGAILSIALIVLFLAAVYLLIVNSGNITNFVRQLFGPIL